MSDEEKLAIFSSELAWIPVLGLCVLAVPAVRFAVFARYRSWTLLLGVAVLSLWWIGCLATGEPMLVYLGAVGSTVYFAATITLAPVPEPGNRGLPWLVRATDRGTGYVVYAFLAGTVNGLTAFYPWQYLHHYDSAVDGFVDLLFRIFILLVWGLLNAGVTTMPALMVVRRGNLLTHHIHADQQESDAVRRTELATSAQEGRLRLNRLAPEEFNARAAEMLRRLIAAADWAVGRTVPIQRIAETDTLDETRAMVEHLQKMKFCKTIIRPHRDPEELVSLTEEGYSQGRIQHPTSTVGVITMSGDYYDVGDNSTVISRSTLQNSMNRVDSSTARALHDIGQHLDEAGSDEAVELFHQFNEELTKPSPRKSVLRTLFEAIERAVPTLSALADSTAKVGQLFQ